MSECAKTVLLIDAGNTRVKFAYYEKLFEKSFTPVSNDQRFVLTHAEIELLADRLRQFKHKPQLIIGVNVAGSQVADKLIEQIDRHCGGEGYEHHWLSSAPQLLHLSNAYADHTQLGADRWLAMLGISVHEKAMHRPAMLVSFGTATTVDTVFQNQFLGGLIFPGLQLMTDSLAQGTAQLPRLIWDKSVTAVNFPRSTVAAMESGIIATQAATVLRQWSAIVAHCQQNPVVFYAGGAADFVMPELTRLLTEQVRLHGFDTIELIPIDDPALTGLLVYAQHLLQQ